MRISTSGASLPQTSFVTQNPHTTHGEGAISTPTSAAMNHLRQIGLIQRHVRGHFVRQQVSVGQEAPGVIRSTIHGLTSNQSTIADEQTPMRQIQKQIQSGAVYHRLSIKQGTQTLSVMGTKRGELPVNPKVQAERAPLNAAVINGGYFVHVPNKETDTGEKIIGIGRTVGETSHRDDHTPVPAPWKQDYRAVQANGKTMITSGPVLQEPNQPLPSFNHDRFRYRLQTDQGVIENPLNIRAGAMSSDNNERAAISIEPNGDFKMHILTAEGNKKRAPTIEQWQSMTINGATPQSEILNVDGGGSVFMGVQTPTGIKQISRGGKPETAIRPIPNILTAHKPTAAEQTQPTQSVHLAPIPELSHS